MKQKIKLYTIDLDGTLLDEKQNGKHLISKKNIEAINKARKNGVKIAISTGRIGSSLSNYANQIKPDYLITGNGSEIFDPNGKLIFKETLTIKQVLKILEIVRKYRLSIKPDNSYHAYGVRTWMQSFLPKKLGWKTSYDYTFPLLQERLKFVIFGSFRRSKIRKVQNEISKISNITAVTSFGGYTVEVTSKNSTKGVAAEFIGKLLKLKKSEIAHIGDSMNDSTTKGRVGQLIVLKNGSKELKKMATHIGPSYKNGGVAKVLEGQIKKA